MAVPSKQFCWTDLTQFSDLLMYRAWESRPQILPHYPMVFYERLELESFCYPVVYWVWEVAFSEVCGILVACWGFRNTRCVSLWKLIVIMPVKIWNIPMTNLVLLIVRSVKKLLRYGFTTLWEVSFYILNVSQRGRANSIVLCPIGQPVIIKKFCYCP